MPSTGSGDFAIGGTFGMVDHAPAQSVARFRQDGWVANPSLPFDSSVTCVSTTSTGDIVVGGGFGRVGGQVAMHVARFDQATSRWTSTNGAGLPFSPTSVAAMEDGTLYASEPTRGVFRLSGNSWTSVLSTADASPYRLIPTPDGRLLVITTADLRIFDGRSWRVISSSVITAAMLPNGDIVAGGLDSAFGVNCPVARWNGTAWSPLAQPNVIDRAVQAILVLPSGDLVIGGGFLNPGRRVARIVGHGPADRCGVQQRGGDSPAPGHRMATSSPSGRSGREGSPAGTARVGRQCATCRRRSSPRGTRRCIPAANSSSSAATPR